MKPWLSAFLAAVVVLFGATQACSGPTAPSVDSQDSPDARATSVRRTAVALFKPINANTPAARAPPGATPLPRPSCPDAIWWHEARSHLGEVQTVQGTIVGARAAAAGAVLLEMGQPYPDPTGVAVLLTTAASPSMTGKTVCVAGRIAMTEGRPTLQVRDAASIVVVN
jgi:hypothetical protein